MKLLFETENEKIELPINPEAENRLECTGECFLKSLVPIVVRLGNNSYQMYISQKEWDRLQNSNKDKND